MTFYIQLKDDIAFAFVDSESPVENSIVLQDGVEPNSVLEKKLVNNQWISPDPIYFIEQISESGVVERVGSTLYRSEVKGEVIPPHVGTGWKKENDEWINFQEIQNQENLEKEKQDLENQINQIINSRPYPSWIWSSEGWIPPVAKPEIDPDNYIWDEENLLWKSVEELEQENIVIPPTS